MQGNARDDGKIRRCSQMDIPKTLKTNVLTGNLTCLGCSLNIHPEVRTALRTAHMLRMLKLPHQTHMLSFAYNARLSLRLRLRAGASSFRLRVARDDNEF